jgi:stage II sporulation protein D
MPGRFYRRASILAVAAAIMVLIPSVSAGDVKVPGTVRVGLYYRDSSVNTAQSIVDISSQAGILLGFTRNDSFTEICRQTGSSIIYIRKDGFYYNTGSGLKEYNPSKSPASGEKYGPYHLKIGDNFPEQANAAAKAEEYRQQGIQAYIAYVDTWQIWTGSFTDQPAAQQEAERLKPVLGYLPLTIVQPSSNRVAAVNAQYQPICIFGSASAYFQARPAPENDPPVITLKGSPYRGAIEFKRLAESDMTVINVVTIQEYLYGNVPPEIGGRSPAEAIKAQAVASKMYAINNIGKHGKTGFDLCATVSCQVYKGYSCELPECNKAIDEVIDKIITYNGAPARHIYYFASGGGSTEDVNNVWGSTYPYLVSVEDKYERIYSWTKTLRASDVKAKLPQLGNILGISITRTAKTGRVTQLAIMGASRGEPVYYTNEKCRTLFGLDSQLYTITTDADVYAASVAYTHEVDKAVASNATASAAGSAPGQDASGRGQSDPSGDVVAAEGQADSISGQASGQGSSASQQESSPGNVSAISLPECSTPVRMQLGGKKVVASSGVRTIKSSGNKISLIGSDGKIKKVSIVPETYTFTGKGWGHAVGMSQEGAIGMANAGFAYDQILEHYFQGTKVE